MTHSDPGRRHPYPVLIVVDGPGVLALAMETNSGPSGLPDVLCTIGHVIGSSLGHYRIIAKLGEGGMGAVYEARDTRLDRRVALKILPKAFVSDPERLARFEREARALAALDHPGIVSIHSLETIERPEAVPSLTFLVMELVEGQTLNGEIPTGGLPLERFFTLAVPLAETVGAAHRKGIVHRDLKPANIMVTRLETIKVLDFGLAKWADTAGAPLEDGPIGDESRTRTLHELTAENQIVGTGPYMSPEQIRTQKIDARSDVFSLGVVLFEMLTRDRPFHGDSLVDLISSILRAAPADIGQIRPEVPGPLRRLIGQCLAKEPSRRPPSAVELHEALAALAAGRDEDRPVDPAAGSRPSSAEGLDPRAVAVLPFANLSRTEEADILATGLHNDVLTELSRVPGLTIISRTSVLPYRDTGKSASRIGSELGVGTIVEGTVQSAGNRVRLTAQLIDAAVDTQRWAERYDGELTTETIFDLQSEVTQKIVASLQSELEAALEMPLARPQTHDLEVYRLCTMGRVQLERRTAAGCVKAIEHFETAVKRDTEYPPGWSGLGEALAIAVWYGYLKPTDRLVRAEQAAQRAVGLDPSSAEAHCALATALGAVRDGPRAMRELRRAVELQPSYWDAHNRISYLAHLHGRADQALEAAGCAVQINPLSAEAVSNLSLSLLTNGDPSGALTEARRAAELSPGWTTASFYEALALLALDRPADASRALTGLDVEWAGLGAQATLGLAHQRAGDSESARQVLASIDASVDAFAAGFVQLALGETEAALERFADVNELSDWACLAVHHLYGEVWHPILEDPHYQRLVESAYRAHGLAVPTDRSENP